MHRALALLLAASVATSVGVASAQDALPLVVEVGKTVEVEVGFAMGHVCDDNSILRAEMRNKNPATNVFVVTGVKVGTTLCRAGTNSIQDRPSFLFQVSVVEAQANTPARRP